MMRVFLQPGDEFLCSNPTFEMFPSRAGLCNAKTVQVPLREDLQYDVEGMLAAVNEKTKLILIINPNNPTGIFIDDADLHRFASSASRCASTRRTSTTIRRSRPRSTSSRSTRTCSSRTRSPRPSAWPACASATSSLDPTVVDAFNLMYLPWNLSLMAIAAAEAILDTGEVKEKVVYNNDWMKKFAEELSAKGLKPFPPHGNYMLVDASVTGKTSAEIVQAANDMQQVIIKTIKPINGKEGYFRVTPGTPEESERFVTFVSEYF